MKVHSQLELPRCVKGTERKLRSFHREQIPLCSRSAALILIGSYPFPMTTSVCLRKLHICIFTCYLWTCLSDNFRFCCFSHCPCCNSRTCMNKHIPPECTLTTQIYNPATTTYKLCDQKSFHKWNVQLSTSVSRVQNKNIQKSNLQLFNVTFA